MPNDRMDGSPSLRILLAEDETVTRMAARALLQRAGHRVVAVEDGPAAVAAAAAEPFDLILMDLGLPGLPGDEAVGAIRRGPGGAAPRILMLTASATAEGQARCAACGADGVLEKPLRPDLVDALSAPARPASPGTGIDAGTAADFDEGALATLREMLPADRAAELIDKAARALRLHGATLREALRDGDRATAALMAHKIAGIAGQYGCPGLRQAARHLEAAIEPSAGSRVSPADGDDLPARTRHLAERLEPALAFLDARAAMARG
ncbi:response regulator [Azospirillum picis]|uniref:CheY-like chemotaxis protein n=1 Tax=Azospirillum picis TaxID=488438 RepID=A0ABU0MF64_9PROT|nr:response regulator [Azospirillum picis]MBP2298236.1 CheY-like chemotaxis protein [Azospirillum picis]MDQ0532074.1 CheY-like chemotaxis protein [Azospirillum picis]